MLATGLSRKPGAVCVVLDDRLSRERIALLTRAINSFRSFTTVDLLGEKTTEDQLLQKMEAKSFDLVLLPWHKYLSWSRAEAFWGLIRTSGPTLAGYFCEHLLPHELGGQPDQMRAILLDFANLSTKEIGTLVKALQKDTTRSGIKPLVDTDAKIYVENWYGAQGLGSRIDSVLGLPEFTSDPRWAKRGNSMRICLNALWSLIYEEGPGKADVAMAPTSSPKAYFQVTCDRETAALRLCYQMPSWTPKNACAKFWPQADAPTSPTQLLLKYADFVRVHTFSGTPEIEIVAGFLASAPAEQAHGQLHTIWVEPLSDKLFAETPYEAPGPANPRLRPLPTPFNQSENKLRALSSTQAAPADPVKKDSSKLIELQAKLEEKEATIHELKSGGVGTAPPLPPPDPESLIEAFQERYFDARFQIRQLELEIVAMEKKGATDEEIAGIRQKMEALANRERAWIKKLAGTLELYKAAGKK